LQLQSSFQVSSSLQTPDLLSFWTSFLASLQTFSGSSWQTFGLSFQTFVSSFPIFCLSSLQAQPRRIVAFSPLVKHLAPEGFLTQEQLQSLWNAC